MKRKTALTILILASIILAIIPESFASPDPNAALMVIGQPPTAIPDQSTRMGNKAAQGFDFVIFVFGLSAGILLARRHNK